MNEPTRQPRTRFAMDLWILGLLLALPSTGFVQKYTGLAGVAGYVLAVVALGFLAARLKRRHHGWLARHFGKLAVLALLGMAAGYVILHPFEDGRGPGKSSDRDEGLEMAVTRMARGETPYYPPNEIAGPLSVLPGSILLAAPFVAMGDVGYQNIFWLGAFLFAAAAFFRDKAVAMYLLVVPMALSVAAQYEFVSGGDLIANGIFVALILLAALKTREGASVPAWLPWLACALVGLALASRANFVFLLPLFGAALWRIAGLRIALTSSAVAGITLLAVILPFYLHDPAGFTPLASRHKLTFMDAALPGASHAIIAATLLASLASAFHLLLRRPADPIPAFFRGCAIVTLTPLLCTILVSSWIHGHPDFGIMRDRFGLMFVWFALLGWGHALLRENGEKVMGDRGRAWSRPKNAKQALPLSLAPHLPKTSAPYHPKKCLADLPHGGIFKSIDMSTRFTRRSETSLP